VDELAQGSMRQYKIRTLILYSERLLTSLSLWTCSTNRTFQRVSLSRA